MDLQKDPGAELPYGKGHTQKVSRVALTLDPAPDKGPDCSHLRFTKAKGRVNRYIKPNGVDIFFDILDGANLVLKEARYQARVTNPWMTLSLALVSRKSAGFKYHQGPRRQLRYLNC